MARDRSVNKENKSTDLNRKRTPSLKKGSPKKRLVSPKNQSKSTNKKDDAFVLASIIEYRNSYYLAARSSKRTTLEPLRYTPSEKDPTPRKNLFDVS